MSKVSSAAQTGILLLGPGALRLNSILANLATPTSEQQEMLSRAKKYAMEQSMKSIVLKQVLTSQQQQQKLLQRHQALVLMCRVYVGSISFELREETIKAAFAPFGAIKSINMSWDQVTLKHKGFAFVEYELPEAAQLALEHMNGIQLGGRQIKVGRPSNMPQAAPIIQQIQEECKEKNRIYVSNVHPDLFEPELANIFDPFGRVRTCKLAMTPNVDKPQHRGYGFIEFETEAAATEALTMDNLDLGGQILHACRATTPADCLSTYGTLDSESTQAAGATNHNSEEDIQAQLERANKEQERDSEKLSEDEHKHDEIPPQKDNQSRVRSGVLEVDPSENVSNILVLRNMVSLDEEIDESLQLDVYEECSKHGAVSQVLIYVEKRHQQNSTPESAKSVDQVKIFVKYGDEAGSQRARRALDGRFFAGRKISAEHYDRTLFRLSDYSK